MPHSSTRSTILARAAPLFNQHGYTGVSIQDVMPATGLKKGGIYNHFADKKDLAARALDEVETEMTAALDDTLGARNLPPLERVLAWLDAPRAPL